LRLIVTEVYEVIGDLAATPALAPPTYDAENALLDVDPIPTIRIRTRCIIERADADTAIKALPYKDAEASFIRLEKLDTGKDAVTDLGQSYEKEWRGRHSGRKNNGGNGNGTGSNNNNSSSSRKFEPLPRRIRLGIDDITDVVKAVVAKTLPSIL